MRCVLLKQMARTKRTGHFELSGWHFNDIRFCVTAKNFITWSIWSGVRVFDAHSGANFTWHVTRNFSSQPFICFVFCVTVFNCYDCEWVQWTLFSIYCLLNVDKHFQRKHTSSSNSSVMLNHSEFVKWIKAFMTNMLLCNPSQSLVMRLKHKPFVMELHWI